MNQPQPRSHYLRRAEQERAAAAAAVDERAAQLHPRLAEEYDKRAAGDEPEPRDEPAASILAAEFRILP